MLKIRNYHPNYLYQYEIDKKYAVKLKELQEGEKITICSDSMFKAMFYNTKRLKYSCKFISYFLDISYEDLLKNMKLSKGELDKEKVSQQGQRCDFVARIEDSLINIEINNNSSTKVMERNIEYAHRLYSEKVKVGKTEEYSQIIQINMNNFSFKGNDSIIDVYYIQNDQKIVLTPKLIFIQIYIPNLRKKWYNEGIDSLNEAEKYALVLIESNVENIKRFGDEYQIMKEYIDEAIESSSNEEIKEAYDKEWALKDEGLREGYEDGYIEGKEQGIIDGKKEGLEQGKKEGLEQGKKEGLEEAKILLTKKLLKDNIDIKKIIEYTELSEEQILEIKENI